MSPVMLAVPAAVTVGLFAHERPDAVTVRASAAWSLRGPTTGRRVPAGQPVTFRAAGGDVEAAWAGGHARAARWRLAGHAPWSLAGGTATRKVAGELAIAAAQGATSLRVQVPFESYVAAVAAQEMPPDWPREALAAQAVAVRSYTAGRVGGTGHSGFDFCDATHCQRFRGLQGADRRVSAAVAATEGELLAWRARPAEATWHAACGGFRAAAGDVFGRATPAYLAGGPDRRPDGRAWCADSPYAGPWAVEAPAATLAAALRAAGHLAAAEPLRGLAVAAAGPGGHVRVVRVAGERVRLVPGAAFWAAVGPSLGWRGIRSPAFTIAAAPDGWRFRGRGLGHGVGMCQAGARARAAAGQAAEAILAAYFPGAEPARVVVDWQPRKEP